MQHKSSIIFDFSADSPVGLGTMPPENFQKNHLNLPIAKQCTSIPRIHDAPVPKNMPSADAFTLCIYASSCFTAAVVVRVIVVLLSVTPTAYAIEGS